MLGISKTRKEIANEYGIDRKTLYPNVVKLVNDFSNRLDYIKYTVNKNGKEYIMNLKNLNEESKLSKEQMMLILNAIGFNSIDDYVKWKKDIIDILEEYPALKNEDYSKQVFESIISENQASSRTACTDQCDRDYWARGIGVAGIGAACLPCGATVALINAGIWIDCLNACD